jgi:hypothetical protein
LSSATLDSLATFETSRADLEDGGDHEMEEPESDLGYPQPFGLEGCELNEADDERDYLHAPFVLNQEERP